MSHRTLQRRRPDKAKRTQEGHTVHTHGVINKQETLEYNQAKETKQEYGNQNSKMRPIKIARHTWKHRNRQGCYISTINVNKSIVKAKHQTDRSNPFHPAVSARTNLQSGGLVIPWHFQEKECNTGLLFFWCKCSVTSKRQTLLYDAFGFLVGFKWT